MSRESLSIKESPCIGTRALETNEVAHTNAQPKAIFSAVNHKPKQLYKLKQNDQVLECQSTTVVAKLDLFKSAHV